MVTSKQNLGGAPSPQGHIRPTKYLSNISDFFTDKSILDPMYYYNVCTSDIIYYNLQVEFGWRTFSIGSYMHSAKGHSAIGSYKAAQIWAFYQFLSILAARLFQIFSPTKVYLGPCNITLYVLKMVYIITPNQNFGGAASPQGHTRPPKYGHFTIIGCQQFSDFFTDKSILDPMYYYNVCTNFALGTIG